MLYRLESRPVDVRRYQEINDNPLNVFPSYGMSDLNPLGGLRDFGEGMLFNPNMRRRGQNAFPGYGFIKFCIQFYSIF